jgi:putative hydrolase of HD superfamily
VLAFAIAAQEGADPERAACLGLFHDFPETRTGDVPSVGKRYVRTADPREVIADQATRLPESLAAHIRGLVAEHEGAKSPDATLEARCSLDADKLECLMQAREYQAAGSTLVQPWVDSMAEAATTPTGIALAKTAREVPPSAWWGPFADAFNARTGAEGR